MAEAADDLIEGSIIEMFHTEKAKQCDQCHKYHNIDIPCHLVDMLEEEEDEY